MNLLHNISWRILAWVLVARNATVADWLIRRSQKTPYFHLDGYMERWWVISPVKWLPFAVRIHHILRADLERHPHNHPWNFRSIILRGWYEEESLDDGNPVYRTLRAGDTYQRGVHDFHRINKVSDGGVWTLFICSKKQGDWGFLVDRQWVFWRDYLNEDK